MIYGSFTFQKDYIIGWPGTGDVNLDTLPGFDKTENRPSKLSKILDRINNVEHTYIKSNDELYMEYFKRRYKEKTKIPHGKAHTR